jgi:hypothetical protein
MADDALPDVGSESPNGDGPTVLTSRKASPEEPYRENEADVVEWVLALRDEAEKGRDEQTDADEWEDSIECYWGETWQGAIPAYKPRIRVNEVKSLLLQELSDLTDSRIKIIVQKQLGSTQRDDKVENSIQTYWKRRFCDLVVLNAALDAMIFPLGFIQSGWDMTAEQGQGEVVFRHRDPRSVYPDPDAQDDDQLRYLILEDVMDLTVIRRDWPETGALVQPEAAYSARMSQSEAGNTAAGRRAAAGYTGPLYTKTGMSGAPGYKKARAGVLTVTVEDDDKIEEINEIAGTLRQRRVPRYPHKRFIQVANRRVLYDADCPFWYAPILTRVMLQPAVHSYWPRASLVSEFAEIQATANKSDSMVAENMLRLNAGEIFADADSGINPKTYGGIPGMVYLIKPGSKVNKVAGVPMPGEMVGQGERLRGFIRSTLGYPLSRTGAGTHGNVAAELAETEISQAMGLTRLRGRLMYHCVQKAVEMIFARQAQFYVTPRHLPYIEDGQLRAVQWEPIAKPEEYAVHVDEASFQVRSKTMLQRIALALAKMQKMPTGRLLKILDIPEADAIAGELKEELVLAAMAKQKQGAKGRSR